MKYFTKEWNKNCSQLVIPMPLEVSHKAEVYSEEFFRTLYNKRLQDEIWLHEAEDESSFQSIFERNVRALGEYLPLSIRREIADIRVLALRVTTKENKRKLEKLYRMQIAEMNRPFDEYAREYKKISRQLKNYMNFDFGYASFHDSNVLSSQLDKGDFIIDLESDYEPFERLRLVLKDASIIKNESDYFIAWWIYDEIYLVGNRIELHVLFDTKTSDNDEAPLELKELIVQASAMQLTSVMKGAL